MDSIVDTQIKLFFFFFFSHSFCPFENFVFSVRMWLSENSYWAIQLPPENEILDSYPMLSILLKKKKKSVGKVIWISWKRNFFSICSLFLLLMKNSKFDSLYLIQSHLAKQERSQNFYTTFIHHTLEVHGSLIWKMCRCINSLSKGMNLSLLALVIDKIGGWTMLFSLGTVTSLEH